MVKMKRKKNRIVLYIIILLIGVGASILFFMRYQRVTSNMLTCVEAFSFDTSVTNAMTIGDDILISTSDGKINLLDSEGKTLWTKDVGSSVFSLEISSDGKYVIIGAVEFHVVDVAGKEIFKKGMEDHVSFKSKYLKDGKIKFIFQSLSDLSLTAVTVDGKGKTLQTEKIDDLGETCFIDISSSGKILLSGERGEVYIIENGGFTKDANMDTKVSTIHTVFGYFFGDSTIVCGYRVSYDPEKPIPVYFFDENLTIKKTLYFKNINDISLYDGVIVFSTKDGIVAYDENGKEVFAIDELGFQGFSYLQNGTFRVCVFFKRTEGENADFVYKIDLLDAQNKKIGDYVYSSDTIPQLFLAANSQNIYLIDKSHLKLISKD